MSELLQSSSDRYSVANFRDPSRDHYRPPNKQTILKDDGCYLSKKQLYVVNF